MANVLTALAPTLWSDGRLVPRELTGFLGACDRNWSDQGAAVGDVVKIPVAPVQTVASITAAATFPSGTDGTASTKSFTLGQTAETSFNLGAEAEQSLMNGGTNAVQYLKQRIAQSCRVITNTIEAYVGTVASNNASRAFGTATTSPFATDQKPLADARKILVDNGAPGVDLHAVIDTQAGMDLRKVANLFKVNEGGSNGLLRAGVLENLYGIDIAESAGVALHTAGTGTSYVVNGSHAIGATSIVIKTGSGTVVAGDVVTINSVQYGVVTGVAAAGTIVIQEPGLRAAASDSDTVTITAAHRANIVMHRNAVMAVIRPYLQPQGGGIEQMTLSDPETGLSFLLLRVIQNAQVSWFVRCAYDAFAPNGFAIAKLLG